MIVELLQTLILLATAPLATGTVRSLKARMQGRTGPSVLQPYRDLVKLFHKSSVMSKDSSWISTITPYVCVAAVVTAALLLPVVYVGTFGLMGDLLLLIYLLAIMKFFTALAALDAGSTFGGMGSSREMFISSIVEPAMLLSIFAMALVAGTTALGGISLQVASTGLELVGPSLLLAAAAFFIAILAENARMPVDNPATHLELTMVHEAMMLEYSGKGLALMEYASMAKLLVFLTLMANMFFPWGIATSADPAALAVGLVAYLVKIGALLLAIAVIESSMAKMRLFRLPNLFTMAFILSLLAVVAYYVQGVA
ncbi:MAG TPA: NADH-quinone oxidoreductase subunit H [Methanomassiliicoccaceae archaeon]|mgnify:CR=1 FL=1|jgi:formate hydrogenlyase subunit 4|nr:NADH-quinone oxidoreductase subunit H [Methanomassiliicoccaceae archaeon]HOQ26226.1 NADH-quinone oxidoreductase subunit H [Methanomassiliicoccaceae archaeon]HPT73458.1 NADH-quinone oxidoreductase subunit H [Methanomassiliicoccaceae archaeon]HQD87926.1 NADH-quinone oxidoreductase subunit H [Methanomassiliicoccaceae archaeon]